MDISALNGVSPIYSNIYTQKTSTDDNKTNSFDSILSAMMQSVDETNDLQNKAESEEIRFALGESDNTHDLLIWGSKNLSTFARNSSLLLLENRHDKTVI